MKKIILAALLVVSIAAAVSAAPLSYTLNSVFKKAYPAAINVSFKENGSVCKNFLLSSVIAVRNISIDAMPNWCCASVL